MKTVISKLIILSAILNASGCSAVQLVTNEEMLKSQKAVPVAEANATPLDPLAPQITLVDPDSADKAIKNPFKMEVLFKPQDGASVDFKSFQALYGGLKLDITERLLKEAVKTPTGLRLANVTVPSGKHRILLRIRDSQNRLAEKEIQFKVE
jgi:hypothetical protein